jgi:hypothetical protein
MRVLVSAVRPSGHLVVLRLPEAAAFLAEFDDDGSCRDISELAPELLLTGALDALEAGQSGRPEPAETVQAANVHYSEDGLPGEVTSPASFSWLHLPSGTGGDFPPADVLSLLARGIGVEVTAGVAAEAASGEVPNDPGDLERPGHS